MICTQELKVKNLCNKSEYVKKEDFCIMQWQQLAILAYCLQRKYNDNNSSFQDYNNNVQCNSSKVRPIKELSRAKKCLVSWIQCYLNTYCVQRKYNDNNASFQDDNNIVQCNSSKVRPIKELPRAIKCLISWI